MKAIKDLKLNVNFNYMKKIRYDTIMKFDEEMVVFGQL